MVYKLISKLTKSTANMIFLFLSKGFEIFSYEVMSALFDPILTTSILASSESFGTGSSKPPPLDFDCFNSEVPLGGVLADFY